MPLTYRPDIDGLRTIAVFSVVLFHLGVPWVPGGFVGVDIFFVISGYLITALLEKDHGQGGISFATFYARRAKRLLPAGFAVFLFALAVGWFLYGTEDYSELALSVAAASVFFANFHFADRTDYFDAPAQD
ncbi:MAG: acyltransferase family protein, partial [Alphaproteobacteria bacterium]